MEISGDIQEQKLGQLSGVPKSGGANVLADPESVKGHPLPAGVNKQAGVGQIGLIGDVEKIEMSASNPPNNSSDAFVDLLGGIPEGCTVEQLKSDPQLLAAILGKMQTVGAFLQFEAQYLDKVPDEGVSSGTEFNLRQAKLAELIKQNKDSPESGGVIEGKLELLDTLGRSDCLRMLFVKDIGKDSDDNFNNDIYYKSISENIVNFASSMPNAVNGKINEGTDDPFSSLSEAQLSDLKMQIRDEICPSVKQCEEEFKSFALIVGQTNINEISRQAQVVTKGGDLILSMMAEARRELRESGIPISDKEVDAKVSSKVSALVDRLNRGEKEWLCFTKKDPRINWDAYPQLDNELWVSSTALMRLRAGEGPIETFLRDPQLALVSNIFWDFCYITSENVENQPALIDKYAAKLHCPDLKNESSKIETIHKFLHAKIQGNPGILRYYLLEIKKFIATCCSQMKTHGASGDSKEIVEMYKDLARMLLTFDMGNGEYVSSPEGLNSEFVNQLGKAAKEDMAFLGTFKNWLVDLFVSIARFFNSDTTKTTYTEDFIMKKLEEEILSEENKTKFKQVIQLISIPAENVNELVDKAIRTMFEKINIDGDTREAVVKRFTKKLEESGVFAP